MFKNEPELFRYLRPVEFNLNRLEIVNKPTGGIAFLFRINQLDCTLSFNVITCRDDENFNYELCRKIALGRKEKNGFEYTIDYDRTLSLTDNVIFWVKHNNIDSLTFITLKSKLKTILKNNNRVQQDFDNFLVALSKKTNAVLNLNN